MTRRPCRSVSSPVFTTTVSSPSGRTVCRPWASFAPPVPPARATTVIPCSSVEEHADLGHPVDRLAVVRCRHPDDEGLEAKTDIRPERVGHLGRGAEEDRTPHLVEPIECQLLAVLRLGIGPVVADDDRIAECLLDRRDVAPDARAVLGEDV